MVMVQIVGEEFDVDFVCFVVYNVFVNDQYKVMDIGICIIGGSMLVCISYLIMWCVGVLVCYLLLQVVVN